MTNAWVFITSEPGLFTVGFYDPSGAWHPESDHTSRDEAADRVHYLNGGESERIKTMQQEIDKLRLINVEMLEALETLLDITPFAEDSMDSAIHERARAATRKAYGED